MQHKYWLTSAVGGTLIKTKGDFRTGGGQRGCISGFSPCSRRRMIHTVRSIDRDRAPFAYLVTLTYPRFFSADPDDWKRDLDTWFKALFRRAPDASAIWKLEPQRRGAPHFHVLVFSKHHIPGENLMLNWIRNAGRNDPSSYKFHMFRKKCGELQQFEKLRSWNGVNAYVSKYVAKCVNNGDLPKFWVNAGRWWGKRGNLPIRLSSVPLLRSEFDVVRRLQRRLAKSQGHKLRYSPRLGCTAFGRSSTAARMMLFAGVDVDRLVFAGFLSKEWLQSSHAVQQEKPTVQGRGEEQGCLCSYHRRYRSAIESARRKNGAHPFAGGRTDYSSWCPRHGVRDRHHRLTWVEHPLSALDPVRKRRRIRGGSASCDRVDPRASEEKNGAPPPV